MVEQQEESREDEHFTHCVQKAKEAGREVKMLQIRKELRAFLARGQYTLCETMLRGVLYADRELCRDIVCYRDSQLFSRPTLMHELVHCSCQKTEEAPQTLIEMVLGVAQPYQILLMEDANKEIPLDCAIWRPSLPPPQKKSLVETGVPELDVEVPKKQYASLSFIQILVEADDTKRSISQKRGVFGVLERAVFRGEKEVAQYLLSLPECKEGVLSRERPLFYASREYVKETEPVNDFVKLWIDATIDEKLRCGTLSARPDCFYTSILACEDRICQFSTFLKSVYHDKVHGSHQLQKRTPGSLELVLHTMCLGS